MTDSTKPHTPSFTELAAGRYAGRDYRKANFAVRAEPAREPDFDGQKTIYLTYNGRQDYPISLAPHEARKLYDLLAAEFGFAPPVAELAAAPRHTYASIANGLIGKHKDDQHTEYVTLADAEAAVRAASRMDDALRLINDLNRIAMSLAADLVKGADRTFQGRDYVTRDFVVERVMQWRTEWDALAPARAALAPQRITGSEA